MQDKIGEQLQPESEGSSTRGGKEIHPLIKGIAESSGTEIRGIYKLRHLQRPKGIENATILKPPTLEELQESRKKAIQYIEDVLKSKQNEQHKFSEEDIRFGNTYINLLDTLLTSAETNVYKEKDNDKQKDMMTHARAQNILTTELAKMSSAEQEFFWNTSANIFTDDIKELRYEFLRIKSGVETSVNALNLINGIIEPMNHLVIEDDNNQKHPFPISVRLATPEEDAYKNIDIYIQAPQLDENNAGMIDDKTGQPIMRDIIGIDIKSDRDYKKPQGIYMKRSHDGYGGFMEKLYTLNGIEIADSAYPDYQSKFKIRSDPEKSDVHKKTVLNDGVTIFFLRFPPKGNQMRDLANKQTTLESINWQNQVFKDLLNHSLGRVIDSYTPIPPFDLSFLPPTKENGPFQKLKQHYPRNTEMYLGDLDQLVTEIDLEALEISLDRQNEPINEAAKIMMEDPSFAEHKGRIEFIRQKTIKNLERYQNALERENRDLAEWAFKIRTDKPKKNEDLYVETVLSLYDMLYTYLHAPSKNSMLQEIYRTLDIKATPLKPDSPAKARFRTLYKCSYDFFDKLSYQLSHDLTDNKRLKIQEIDEIQQFIKDKSGYVKNKMIQQLFTLSNDFEFEEQLEFVIRARRHDFTTADMKPDEKPSVASRKSKSRWKASSHLSETFWDVVKEVDQIFDEIEQNVVSVEPENLALRKTEGIEKIVEEE